MSGAKQVSVRFEDTEGEQYLSVTIKTHRGAVEADTSDAEVAQACPECGQDMNLPPNTKCNPCPLCGQGRGANKDKMVKAWAEVNHRGSVIRFHKTRIATENQMLRCVVWISKP